MLKLIGIMIKLLIVIDFIMMMNCLKSKMDLMQKIMMRMIMCPYCKRILFKNMFEFIIKIYILLNQNGKIIYVIYWFYYNKKLFI